MTAYEDLIEREHPEPRNHARMPRSARAAQFAPFAALTGYDGALAERRRTTEDERYLDEAKIEELDRLLRYAAHHPSAELVLTFFVPDARKKGGSYRTLAGRLKRIDTIAGELTLVDGTKIPITKITNIEVNENESTQ